MATATAEAPSHETDVQWICRTTPDCLCLNGEQGAENHDDDGRLIRNDECVCSVEPTDGKCGRCGSPMVLIDVNSGEPIETKAS